MNDRDFMKNEFWALPSCAILLTGVGTGSTSLNAFDSALFAAGIGDFNLVKVSSILPPGSRVYSALDGGLELLARLPKGLLLPTVYGTVTSRLPSSLIASAVGVGVSRDDRDVGTIFEVSLSGSRLEAEEMVRAMVKESLVSRNIAEYDIIASSSEAATIVATEYVCVLSAAVLLIT